MNRILTISPHPLYHPNDCVRQHSPDRFKNFFHFLFLAKMNVLLQQIFNSTNHEKDPFSSAGLPDN